MAGHPPDWALGGDPDEAGSRQCGASGDEIATGGLEAEEDASDLDLKGREVIRLHYATRSSIAPVTTPFHAARMPGGSTSSSHRSTSSAPST